MLDVISEAVIVNTLITPVKMNARINDKSDYKMYMNSIRPFS